MHPEKEWGFGIPWVSIDFCIFLGFYNGNRFIWGVEPGTPINIPMPLADIQPFQICWLSL